VAAAATITVIKEAFSLHLQNYSLEGAPSLLGLGAGNVSAGRGMAEGTGDAGAAGLPGAQPVPHRDKQD